MKAKLIFNLPEDNFDFLLATCASDMYSILRDLKNKLKYELKHNDDLTQETYEYLDKLYDELYEEINELPCSKEFY